MGEKADVRQFEQTGCVISHDVDNAWDTEDGTDEAAVKPLIKCLDPEQVRRVCSQTLLLPGHCWSIVGAT